MPTDAKQYLSPIKKLARFFEESRDRWKEKCQLAKRQVKFLQTKVGDLQASRDSWKLEAKELRRLLAEQEQEAAQKISGARA